MLDQVTYIDGSLSIPNATQYPANQSCISIIKAKAPQSVIVKDIETGQEFTFNLEENDALLLHDGFFDEYTVRIVKCNRSNMILDGAEQLELEMADAIMDMSMVER